MVQNVAFVTFNAFVGNLEKKSKGLNSWSLMQIQWRASFCRDAFFAKILLGRKSEKKGFLRISEEKNDENFGLWLFYWGHFSTKEKPFFARFSTFFRFKKRSPNSFLICSTKPACIDLRQALENWLVKNYGNSRNPSEFNAEFFTWVGLALARSRLMGWEGSVFTCA